MATRIIASIFWPTLFLVTLPTFSTLDQLHIGEFLPAILASFGTGILGIGVAAFFWFQRDRSGTWRRNIVGLILLLSALWISKVWLWGAPIAEGQFEDRVLYPMPVGISEIKVTGFSIFGAKWSYQFKADEATIQQIISKHSLLESAEVLSELPQEMIPPWVTAAPPGQLLIYQRIQGDTKLSRGRTLCLAYDSKAKQAWFLLFAPL